LDHKHIVTYYGGEISDNNVFCVYLEYLSGGSIADLYKRYGRLGESICKQYTIQVIHALIYLHSKDVVHGDLKGANVLLTKGCEHIKLCDLGSSRLLEQEQSWQSLKSVINGTLAWMAPESYESKMGKKSDVLSLGCLVVEMLTGENPWGKRLEDGNAIIALQRAL
jgi:serine/threonine protein kinase